jgi:uncharacterized delta-60 repeat protein
MSISNINAVPYNTIQYISGVPILSISYINGVQTTIAPPLQYLLIGGQFTIYNSPSLPRIAKIDGDGNLIFDSTFNPGAGFSNGAVQDIQQQPDGKYIMVGSFTSYSGSNTSRIVKINPNGTRDTTFDVGSATGLNATQGFTISPQSDNSVIVGGNFTTYKGVPSSNLVKISPSGALDASFNVGNGFRNTVYGIATQPDGKVIAVGTFNMYSGSLNFYTTRTDLSGSLNMGPGTTFNPGVGFSSTVNFHTTQSDGKIIAVGDFTTYSGSTSNRIVRINTDGTRDTTFNVGTGFNVQAYKVIVQSDGKIVISGAFTTYSGSSQSGIIRLNTDGTRDTTFNVGNGINNNPAYALSLQSDGKYIIAGNYLTYSGSTSVRITRINTDGTLDTTFNPGAGFNSLVWATAIQPDGKIVAVGSYSTYSGSSVANITRINTDGTRDTTFNVGTGTNSVATNAIIEPSTNKVIVVGNFTTYSGSSTNTSRIVRINPNGTQDTSFVSGTGFGSNVNSSTHLSIESDGKIYVGGGFFALYNGTTVNSFARINSSGSLDTTFPYTSSTSAAGFSNTVRSIFISGSNIYFAGSYTSYRPINNIIRLNTDGTQDTSFAIGPGLSSQAFAVKPQSDGKIIVGGAFGAYSGSTSSGIVRLNTDGTRDTTFNVGTGFNASVYSFDIQSDGKILALGNFTAYSGSSVNRITRINTDGTRDDTFNIGTGIDVFLAASSNKILASSDGGVYVSSPATTTYSGSFTGNLWKINSDGTLNSSFNTTTTVLNTPVGGFAGVSQAGAYTLIQSGSSIIAAGTGFTTYKNALINRGVMIDSTGAISSSFNIGTNNNVGLGFNGTVQSWVTQSDGKILAGGQFTLYSGSSNNRIVRINTNGTLDTTFNTGFAGGGFNSAVYDLRVQSDGKIIAVGAFTTYSGSSVSGIVRLNTNGTRDTTFNVGAGFTLSSQGNHCKIQSDGKIVVVGIFTTYSGSTANRIVRINTDGTIDNTFNVGAGFNQNMEAVILQSDGKIITTGNFTSYSGSSLNRIVRINTDGTRDTTFNIGTGLANSGFAVALQNDGKIVCTSLSQTYSGSTNRFIIRINTDGTRDTTFNANAISGLATISSTPNSLAIANDGKIYWGNNFSTFSGSFVPNRIVRLNTNGSVDETFNQSFPNFANNTGKGANFTVHAVLLL